MDLITASNVTLIADFDQPQFLYPMGEHPWPVLPLDIHVGLSLDRNLHQQRITTTTIPDAVFRGVLRSMNGKPTKPGWYWAIDPMNGKWAAMEADLMTADGDLMVRGPAVRGEIRWTAIEETSIQWGPPIPEPRHPATKIKRSTAAQIERMADRFLSWKLPESVLADPCACQRTGSPRYGTNLLDATEARQMVEHLLTTEPLWMSPHEASEMIEDKTDIENKWEELTRAIGAHGPESDPLTGTDTNDKIHARAMERVRDLIAGQTERDPHKPHQFTHDTSRPDLFQAAETAYHFPCSSCIHVEGPQDHCRNCCHYVL